FQMFIFLVLLAVSIAAPTAGNDPTVSILRYNNDQDLENIQRDIIAQYERLGGTTQVHKPRTANIINPANLGIYI
ncbi:hypothetical protein KR084_007811, partial [Drosophila pseudotakahashii]